MPSINNKIASGARKVRNFVMHNRQEPDDMDVAEEPAHLQQQMVAHVSELRQKQAEALMAAHAEQVLMYFERIESMLGINTGTEKVIKQNGVSLSIQIHLHTNRTALEHTLSLFEDQVKEPEVMENRQLFTRMFNSVSEWAEPLIHKECSIVHEYCLAFMEVLLPVADVDVNGNSYHLYRELQSVVRRRAPSQAPGRIVIHRAINSPEEVHNNPLNGSSLSKFYAGANNVRDTNKRVENGDNSLSSMVWNRQHDDLR